MKLILLSAVNKGLMVYGTRAFLLLINTLTREWLIVWGGGSNFTLSGNFCITSKQFLSSISTDEKKGLVHASFVTTYMFTGCKQVSKEFQILLFCQEIWVLFSGIFIYLFFLKALLFFLNVLGPLEDRPLSFTRMWPLIFGSLHIGQICLRRPEAALPLTI